MKRFMIGMAIVAFVAVTASAQTRTTKTDTKVDVKNGKDVQLTGCIETASGPANYRLTNGLTDGKDGTAVHDYYLIGDVGDLKNHVGHMMEIHGKMADAGKGKVVVETKTKVEREHADDSKTSGKTEVKGDLNGAPLPFIDVSSIKMLRASCNVS